MKANIRNEKVNYWHNYRLYMLKSLESIIGLFQMTATPEKDAINKADYV